MSQTHFPLDESKLPFTIPKDEKPREKILKLGQKITDRIPAKLRPLTAEDPEYWGLAGLITDEKGRIVIRHLDEGSYRLWESEAPEGFLTDNEVRYFTIDRNGLAEGLERFEIEVEDDFTKVDLSKRDITDESEVVGAHLAVLDEDGEVVEEWTSEQTDHRIEALVPGTYTLVELRTPHDYDEATAVTFTVEATGDIQRVVMYDEPIEISAQIDKRQQIADPILPYTDADKTVDDGGANNAPVTASEDGSYSYTVDFQSTSTTWVDEFTVTDKLHAAEDGLAELVSITTPAAGEDYDGKLNVWYRTNKTPEDFIDPSAANATLGDGHANPWLTDETTATKLGDDGRAVSYAGWELWAQDVDAATPAELEVGALELAEDEHIIGLQEIPPEVVAAIDESAEKRRLEAAGMLSESSEAEADTETQAAEKASAAADLDFEDGSENAPAAEENDEL